MRISVLKSGQTYVGVSDLMTTEEWSEYVDSLFDPTKDKSIQSLAGKRAKSMGGRRVKSTPKHGPGFVFYQTPDELERLARIMYSQLF